MPIVVVCVLGGRGVRVWDSRCEVSMARFFPNFLFTGLTVTIALTDSGSLALVRDTFIGDKSGEETIARKFDNNVAVNVYLMKERKVRRPSVFAKEVTLKQQSFPSSEEVLGGDRDTINLKRYSNIWNSDSRLLNEAQELYNITEIVFHNKKKSTKLR